MSTLLPSNLSLGDLERVRESSKALLGNRYRLEIAAVIGGLEGDLFHAKELADSLALPHNIVSMQVKAFVDAGVCDDGPSVAGQRHRYFRRRDSAYWASCRALMTEFAGRSASG